MQHRRLATACRWLEANINVPETTLSKPSNWLLCQPSDGDLKEQWKELVSGSASRFRFNSFEVGREIVAQPLFDQADGHS